MSDNTPEPKRDGKGADIVGPRNPARERQDPFTIRSPETDHGSMPNLKWSFADSHVRIEKGGWARETTVRELPIAKDLSGVNMRLEAGAVRELHWHKQAEWSYMLRGNARITVVDEHGRTFADDVSEGDLWYFPAGIPHSIQGLDSDVDGCEFLLVFDDGAFSEENTFLLTDWLAHTPRDVIAKNFGAAEDELAGLPSRELYIFPRPKAGPLAEDRLQAPARSLGLSVTVCTTRRRSGPQAERSASRIRRTFRPPPPSQRRSWSSNRAGSGSFTGIPTRTSGNIS